MRNRDDSLLDLTAIAFPDNAIDSHHGFAKFDVG